jgi:hypothetical protein
MARPKGAKNKPKYPEHVKYREDWVTEWLMEIAGGKTMQEVYMSNTEKFPHPTTVGQWLVKHDDFYEKYLRARRAGAEVDADFIRYIADNCDEGSAASVQKARLQVDTRMKIISKLLPAIYGERVQVDQTVDDKRELDTKSVESALERLQKRYMGVDEDDSEMTTEAIQ